MPIHDWTRVDAGIFHAFHHGWIEEISRALNRGVLPAEYYALPEQNAGGFDGVPKWPMVETDLEFYRRKQKVVTIRRDSDDRAVAMVKIWRDTTSALNVASYETGNTLRAYVINTAFGEALADMPLFLAPQQTVTVALEAIYNAAYAEVPPRWRRVLDAPGS